MGKPSKKTFKTPEGPTTWTSWPYRIGCPVWACKQWGDCVYPQGTPSESILAWYSRMFPTVEGNSTFYSVPPRETFLRWCNASADGFRFCFKFPRDISHDRRLEGCEQHLSEWLSRLEILAERERLGTTFLQLAPSFSSRHFEQLAQFLNQLPSNWSWSVEVRHPDWFDEGKWESRLDALLRDHQIDRVLFDSRPLNAWEATDDTESVSQSRKPKLPLRWTVTGTRPMLRLIGRNAVAEVDPYWEEWAERIAGWIRDGLEPLIFTHAPDDAFAPELARALHDKLQSKLPDLKPLPSLPSLSGEDEGRSEVAERLIQLRWF